MKRRYLTKWEKSKETEAIEAFLEDEMAYQAEEVLRNCFLHMVMLRTITKRAERMQMRSA